MKKANLKTRIIFFATVAIATVLRPSVAHAGLLDGLKNVIQGVVDAVTCTVDAIGGAVGDVVTGSFDAISSTKDYLRECLVIPFFEAFFGKCPDSSTAINNYLSNCWVCKLFYKFFDAINLLSTAVYNYIHLSCITLLAVCLLFFILFKVGKAIMSFLPQDPMDLLNQLGKIFFKTVFAVALLSQSAGVLGNLIFSPMVSTVLDFDKAIVSTLVQNEGDDTPPYYAGNLSYSEYFRGKANGKNYIVIAERDNGLLDDIGDWWGGLWGKKSAYDQAKEDLQNGKRLFAPGSRWYEVVVNSKTSVLDGEWWSDIGRHKEMLVVEDYSQCGGLSGIGEGMFDEQVRCQLEALIRTLYQEMAFGLALSSSLICNSWMANFLWDIIPYPNIGMLAAGLALWVTCGIIILFFAFKIIDATLRLAILGSLLPLLIVSWVFPATVSYAKQGFLVLLQILLMYVVLAIVLALSIVIMTNAFTMGADEGIDMRQMFLDDNVRALAPYLSLFSVEFFFGLLACLLAVMSMQIVEKMASEYSGVSFGKNAGNEVGAMFSKVAMVTAQAVTRAARLGGMKTQNYLRDRKIGLSGAGGSDEGIGIDSSSHSSGRGATPTNSYMGRNAWDNSRTAAQNKPMQAERKDYKAQAKAEKDGLTPAEAKKQQDEQVSESFSSMFSDDGAANPVKGSGGDDTSSGSSGA